MSETTGTFSNLFAFDHYPAPSIVGLPRPAVTGTVMLRTLVGNGVMTGLLGANGTITLLPTRLIPVLVAFQIADLAYLKATP